MSSLKSIFADLHHSEDAHFFFIINRVQADEDAAHDAAHAAEIARKREAIHNALNTVCDMFTEMLLAFEDRGKRLSDNTRGTCHSLCGKAQRHIANLSENDVETIFDDFCIDFES